MAVNSLDPITGAPRFLDTDPPDIKVDPTEAADYAADVGNRIVRASLGALEAYPHKRPGLAGYAIDGKTEYIHSDTGWVPVLGDTGWIEAPLQSGWIQATGDEAVEYRRLNGVVYLKGRVANGTGTTMFVLPAGFRPKHLMRLAVKNGATNTTTYLDIQPTGAVVSPTGVQPVLSGVPAFPADN